MQSPRAATRLTLAHFHRQELGEPRLLNLVLIHLGTMKSQLGKDVEAMERSYGTQLALMWIGDSVLHFLITEQLIARYSTYKNSGLHAARISLASRISCAQ